MTTISAETAEMFRIIGMLMGGLGCGFLLGSAFNAALGGKLMDRTDLFFYRIGLALFGMAVLILLRFHA